MDIPMEHTEDEFLKKHHNHNVRENQLSSYIVKRIKAPVDLVWSLVRRFDQPLGNDCESQGGDLKIGSIRQLNVHLGLEAITITEKLEILDDEERVFGVRRIDRAQRTISYKSIVTVHPEMIDGRPGTLVVESYVADVADGKSKEETCNFVEVLINSNLISLARRSEKLAAKQPREPMKQKLNNTKHIYIRNAKYVITEAMDFRSVVQNLTGVHNTYKPNSKMKSIENAVEDKLKSTKQDTLPLTDVFGESLLESSGPDESSLTVNSMGKDLSESFAVQDPCRHEWNSKPKAFEETFEYPFEDTWKYIIESEFESSNRDETSLYDDWMAQEMNLTNGRCSELHEHPSYPFLTSLNDDWMAQEINLTNGRCSELREQPSYPFLVKLFLQNNNYLTEIPSLFFGYMPNLEVLDMSNTSIKKLPLSIAKLFKLQELLLRSCKMLMELPSQIRYLSNLKVLDLEETELIRLPKEIRCLHQLESLKFSLYKYANHHKENSIIPKKTLSKLYYLKELSIDVSPDCEWWEAEVEAIIADLGKLGNLETLKMYLPTHNLFQKLLERRCIKRLKMDVVMPLLYPTLSNFQFVVGRYEDPIMSCVPHDLQDEFVKLEKCLKYVNLGEYLDPKVLQHVSALFIRRHWSIRTLSEFDLTKMNNLKFCLLAECDLMKAILDGHQLNHIVNNNGGKSTLGSLRYLGIHYMKNLFHIWKGPVVKGCLSNLKILAIHTCPNLTTIFNHGFFEELIFLQELIVEDCPKVQSLVARNCSHLKKDILPSLKKISLLHLPGLKIISYGQCIASRLEKMVIYNCPKLENLHPLEMCSKDVKEIKGESKWWESNKSGWTKEEHDYLVSVFVPLKVVDDDDDDDDDNDEIDELAEAVRVSLTSQATDRNEDLIVDMDMEMKDKIEEHPKEIGASTFASDEPLIVEQLSSKFSTSNPTSLSLSRFFSCLLADRKPGKNPNFFYASFARTLRVVNLSGYNLSDDSIPEDLSVLSSLSELDLSFTPISALQKGTKWPNGLKFLNLNGCTNLRFLRGFPWSLQVLAVNDCKSLERVNFGSNKLESAPVSLLSHGCGKLVEVDSAFSLDQYTDVWGGLEEMSDYFFPGYPGSSTPIPLEPPTSTKFYKKKSNTMPSWTEQVQVSQGTIHDDGFSWRKYWQKPTKGSPYPRNYYRCNHKNSQGCCATKQVQRANEDSTIFNITYRGRHTCTQDTLLTPPPPQEMVPNFQRGLNVKIDDLDLSDNVEDHDIQKTMPSWTKQVQVFQGTFYDGFSWTKYGQKDIPSATCPRSYYRCAHQNSRGCLAKKQIQQSDEDSTIFNITYTGRHTCTQDTDLTFPPPQETVPNFQRGLKVEIVDLDPSDNVEDHDIQKTMPSWTKQVQVSQGNFYDGFSWTKYGQNDIPGATYPRSYYRCAHQNSRGCLAKKQVQQSDEDSTIFNITYTGRHTCTQDTDLTPPPPQETVPNFQKGLKVEIVDLDPSDNVEFEFDGY